MERFRYHPLGPEEIRLLQLCPSQSETDPLQCSLVHTTLDRCAVPDSFFAYEALSYVWGGERCKSITCNGKSFVISFNLDEALRSIRKRQIRYPSFHHMLWVDAICINQEDDLERGHQVRQMKAIYHSARSVLIWLGGPTLERYANKFVALKREQQHFETLLKVYPVSQQQSVDSRSSSAMAYLKHLPQRIIEFAGIFDQPWFHRIWVIQEAVMARKVKVLCGSAVLTWNNLLEAAGLVCTHLKFSDDWFRTRMSCKVLLRLENMRKRLGLVARPKSPGHPVENTPKDLFELMQGYRIQQATDPRDKIYALLGIAKELDSDSLAVRVEPDYSLSSEAVYLSFARMILDGYQPLRLLKAIDWRLPKNFQIPSWTPDWSITGVPQVLSNLCAPEYCLDPQYRAIIYKQADLHILKLAGKKLDVVSETSQLFEREDASSHEMASRAIQKWLSLARQDWVDVVLLQEVHRARIARIIAPERFQIMVSLATKALDSIRYNPSVVNPHTSVYREFRDGSKSPGFWNIDRFEQASRLAYDARNRSDSETAFWKCLLASPTHSLGPSSWNILYADGHRFKEVCVGRKFIVTKKGHYGIAPPTTQAGDTIVLFPGTPLPFVVGPRDSPAGDTEVVLRGEVFVQDVSLDTVMQNRKIKLRDFVLH